METLPLIDVSLEDDLLISLPEPANASKGEILVKTSKQLDYAPEISESPKRKPAKSGKVNLRKSLAWDSAFFTSEGVLDTEELAIVHDTFRKTGARSLPGIQEEVRKSTESTTSTLDSESYALESLEGGLFNLRASIQMPVTKRDDSRKKVGLPCQTKIKPPLNLKRDGVSKQRLECTSKEAVIAGKVAVKGGESSKLSLKPPRVVHKPASLLPVPSNIARRTPAGNGANRQGIVPFSKTAGDSHKSPLEGSSSSIKPSNSVVPVDVSIRSFTQSGLRKPTPKIGYFDTEKTLVGKIPQTNQNLGGFLL